ncbi:bifunctional 4-hydroxy-2-oxoglutarate aldolase/2-dehydro-3-deoxy-phosphogluconate aldolase [Chroococcidiopsis sp. FACHB-1243]|uniref:bifunctional 4-hydroxy-2-oxoglutarate aldolase/2-dehydro-3-deoxy-phosphogluconate aldolase n=1 Tax=Chroococcidiopsis sp. [FACHB-1243] TaxID=2692781 RepID=UPI00177C497C|nr:bifunctional 4-hydroxy-2-oxoglutarate aldolase/2-dehydro-3-deoxy-phosphogluconate aldolase [Chroococcidiopsis sp. [FACHB-1243]]MBD2307926.1 bifunctional 4-hydroxy-2-oxoglutarate aldolase/2-dehydro-3-deoxy-phosphogluconate aldolase [Chroococcidiopsis sp. [FACHB-1243]]
MFNDSWLKLLQQNRAIAVIRANKIELGCQMAKAVAAGGMQLIEVTWNSDRPAELISQLRRELPACTIGTGTILTLEQLQQAIASGAQFLFTPHVDSVLIQAAVARGIPIVPGALSPTEIVTAWMVGASCVKVFPVQALGGVSYIKNLQAPLGNIPLIPTGGVSLENAKEFIAAGAIAVGLSGQLFPKSYIEAENWEAIAQLAKTLMLGVGSRESGVGSRGEES